jgi:dynein heavy chain
VPEAMEDLTSMKKLWVHEVLRVYCDRLVDNNDHNWLFDQLCMVVEERLEEDMDAMFSHLRTDNKEVIHIYRIDSVHLTFFCASHSTILPSMSINVLVLLKIWKYFSLEF